MARFFRMCAITAAAAAAFVFGHVGPAGPAGGWSCALGAEARAGESWADFTLQTPSGERVSLKEFVGKKPVLLAFWATWCPHCNDAVPALNALVEGPAKDRLQLIAVDYLESRQKVGGFVKSKKIAYTVLLDETGKVSRSYGVLGIPTYVVISRGGRIVYRGNELPKNLEAYF